MRMIVRLWLVPDVRTIVFENIILGFFDFLHAGGFDDDEGCGEVEGGDAKVDGDAGVAVLSDQLLDLVHEAGFLRVVGRSGDGTRGSG